VLAAFALIGTLSPSYQKCTADHERHDSQNEQPDLDKTIASSAYVPLFFVCEGAFVDENNGTLTALATIAIAGFTLTLWRATTKQAGLTRDAIELGNREFVATHRPKLILREAFSPITDSLDSRITLAYTIANVGASDCWMAEAQIGLELVREIGYPIFMMPADMSFPNNVPFIGRIVAGEHRRLTFVDPVQVWDNDRRYRWDAQKETGLHFVGCIAYIDAPGSNIGARWLFGGNTTLKLSASTGFGKAITNMNMPISALCTRRLASSLASGSGFRAGCAAGHW